MNREALVRVSAVAGGVLAWQVVTWVGSFPTWVLPGPALVARSLVEGMAQGDLPRAIAVSLWRLVIGYGAASLVGILAGIAMARVAAVERVLGTWIAGLQSLPSICWMPLALLWFGLNDRAILFVVVQASFGTVSLAVRDAVRNVPPLWIRAARNMGERGLGLWLRVLLPAALPGTVSALRSGWSFAWRALMAGELLFVAGGLGQVMHVGRELNDMPRVMAGMVVIVALGLLFDSVILGMAETRMRRRRGLG